MQISPRKQRILREISTLLVPIYGRDNLEWDPDEADWLWIKNFPLPKGWMNRRTDSPLYNKAATPLLLEIPRAYPTVAPQNFYAERDLQCGTDFIGHYFDKPNSGLSANRHTDKGWAWLCIHVHSWEYKTNFAYGDNLLTICRLITDILSDKRNATSNHYR